MKARNFPVLKNAEISIILSPIFHATQLSPAKRTLEKRESESSILSVATNSVISYRFILITVI
jgi:hypothetical protein